MEGDGEEGVSVKKCVAVWVVVKELELVSVRFGEGLVGKVVEGLEEKYLIRLLDGPLGALVEVLQGILLM